ncbi:expressed protein, partial [Phakopsora pachyrhizi]
MINLPAKINLSLTLKLASNKIESFSSKDEIKWSDLEPSNDLIEVKEDELKLIETEYLPKLRLSFISLYNKLGLQDLSSLQPLYVLNHSAHSVIPISELIIATTRCLREMLRNRSLEQISPTRQVPVLKIILVAQEIKTLRGLWLELLAIYKSHADGFPKGMRYQSLNSKDRFLSMHIHEQLIESTNQAICRMNCYEENQSTGRESQVKFCTYHYGCHAVIKPQCEYGWLAGQLANRLETLSHLIDETSDDLFCANNFTANLSLTILKNLDILKDQISYFKESFFEPNQSNSTVFSLKNSNNSKEVFLELSQVITEQILNLQVALKLSIYDVGNSLNSIKNFALSKSQITWAEEDVYKIHHYWLTLLRCVEGLLLRPKLIFKEGAQTVLSLEIGWLLEQCFKSICQADQHLTSYSHSHFLEDFDSLESKLSLKLRLINIFTNQSTAINFEDIAEELEEFNIQEDLSCQSQFLKAWYKLLALFKLFINKATCKDRKKLNIHSLLNKHQSILLIQELNRWSYN